MRMWSLLLGVLVMSLGCGSKTIPTACEREEMDVVSFRTGTEGDKRIRVCVDTNLASRVDATRTSAGRDESRAESRPGVIPWTNLTFDEALLACGRAGKYLCERRVQSVIGATTTFEGGAGFEAQVTALSPTEDSSGEFDQLEIVTAQEPNPEPFPDTVGSIAVWAYTSDAETASDYKDGQRMVYGRVLQDSSSFHASPPAVPLFEDEYRHPFLGFRCCLDTRLQGVFEELDDDPGLIRAAEDDELTILESADVPDAGGVSE